MCIIVLCAVCSIACEREVHAVQCSLIAVNVDSVSRNFLSLISLG